MKRRQLIALLLSLIFLAGCGQLFIQFLIYHQASIDNGAGIRFNDFILELFPVGDFSIYIFGITYSCLLLFVSFRVKKASELAKFTTAYALILLTRIVTIYLIPMKEPSSLVSLNDPILYNVIFSSEITADLFYSGHTAFVFVMYFLSKKPIYAVLGSILGILLMMQRVHYSIDIAVAIPFAYGIAKLVEWFFAKTAQKNNA